MTTSNLTTDLFDCLNGNVCGDTNVSSGGSPFNCTNVTCQPEAKTEPPSSEGNPYILPWYLQLVYIIIFVSMVIVAAGGNIIVIWIVLAHKRMRTVTNYFLVNLAVADALISILNTLFNFVYMLYSDWPFGKSYCRFSQFIAPCTISASVFTFMAIAIDRYMAIIHPLKPRLSARTVLGVISVIWLASVAIAFPNLVYAQTHTWTYSDTSTRTVCFLRWPDGLNKATDLAYNIFLMCVNYFVPLAILTVTYVRVGVELWGSQTIGEYTTRQEENVRSKRKVVKMMIVVVIIFGVCWLPQHVFFIASNKKEDIQKYVHIQHIYLVIYWLAMSNSMYNPIIYCWMNARFRKGFKYVFRWMPCIRFRTSDNLNKNPGTSVRMSVSEGTRFERNGSMIHTLIETMEESTYCPPTCMTQRGGGFTNIKRDNEQENFKGRFSSKRLYTNRTDVC